MAGACREILISFCLVFASEKAIAQSYPRWFLDQGAFPDKNVSVGYAEPSLYEDSSASRAFLSACENMVRQTHTKVTGGQMFWATEAGTYWIGSDIREGIDTSKIVLKIQRLRPIATWHGNNIVVVLAGATALQMDSSFLVCKSVDCNPPIWTESLPRDETYFYAVGLSPEYYHETSSWKEVERNARLNLARQIFVELKALQKSDGISGQEIRNEEISVELHNVEILARWRDVKKKIFYVLARMPKSQ
ncbi:MAG: LPP20 family lipoprotein [Candidatus Edwardsbacteria bacterium]